MQVQLFGIRVFNTKDAISERFWSMAAPQGEVISSWPLKGAAWLCKKLVQKYKHWRCTGTKVQILTHLCWGISRSARALCRRRRRCP